MTAPRRRAGVGKSRRYIMGRLSENRVAWVRTAAAQFNILRYDNNSPDPDEEKPKIESEVGDDIFLMIPQSVGSPVTINITGMSEAEFARTRELFDLLFTMAAPIIRTREKVARDAFAAGDDSHSRIYRALPEFVVRQGKISTDSEGLLVGPTGDDDGAGDARDQAGRVSGSGDELADGKP